MKSETGRDSTDLVDTVRKYHDQNLGQVWTFDGYKRYERAQWSWVDLPFSNDYGRREYKRPQPVAPIRGSILEVGSAMGAAYDFIKSSGLIDLSDYTGIEVSDIGVETSRKRFPNAKWIHTDFTRYVPERQYDFVYERVSVHHMPEPIAQFRKMLKATRIAMMTSFRGCLSGETVSDLSKGFFRTRDDKYYCNIISLPEIVKLGIEQGFRHIRVAFCGLHEPIGTDLAGYQYVAPEIQAEGRMISRFQIRFSRLPEGAESMMYATTSRRLLLTQFPAFMKTRRILAHEAASSKAIAD